jgi:hypothetical protein
VTDLTEMATPTPRDVYDHEKKLGRLGNCYENAVMHVLFKDKKAKLVHGRPTHQVGGYEFGHAWTEKGEVVYDPETGFKGPRDMYYLLGHINPDDCKVYGAELARKWLLYSGYYGPFEGVDAHKPINDLGRKKPRTGRKAKHTAWSKQEQEWKKAMDAMRDSKGEIDPQKEFQKATEKPPVKVGLGKGRPATEKPWAEYDRRAVGLGASVEDLGEARSAFSEAVKEARRIIKIKGNLCHADGKFAPCDELEKAGVEPEQAGVEEFIGGWAKSKQRALSNWRTGKAEHQSVSGKLDKKNVRTAFKNARSVLKTYAKNLPGDDVNDIHGFLRDQEDLMEDALGEGSFDGVSSKAIDKMMSDAVDSLVYQTAESYNRQLGDHGVRHIKGNIDTMNSIFDALGEHGMGEESIGKKDRFMAAMVMVNHDIGYTAKPARTTIEYTGEHKKYSSQIFDKKLKKNYESVFGKDSTEKIRGWIETHDSDEIDWDGDPIASSVRVSDNLSLYAKEKLPAVFKYVPGAIEDLEEIHKAYQGGKKERVEEIKTNLKKKIKESKFPKPMQKALMNAAKEVFAKSGKFALGILGGEVGKMDYDGQALNIEIKKNDYDTRLQKMFDMGQLQFKKFAESYGIEDLKAKDFEFKRDGDTVLRAKIV